VNGISHYAAFVHDVSVHVFAMHDPRGEQKKRSDRDADERDNYGKSGKPLWNAAH
jgi:hypothetical protein